MECLTDFKLYEYIDDGLGPVEKAMVRDHLIVCETCRLRHERFEMLESQLQEPVYIEPPAVIERNVLRTLFSPAPSLSSVLAFLAASFFLLVTGIYVYFDFANNSVFQAIQLASHNTSSWLASTIKAISSTFSGVYGVFKAINKFFEIIFNVNIGIEIIGLTIVMLTFFTIYALSHLVLKRIKGNN